MTGKTRRMKPRTAGAGLQTLTSHEVCHRHRIAAAVPGSPGDVEIDRNEVLHYLRRVVAASTAISLRVGVLSPGRRRPYHWTNMWLKNGQVAIASTLLPDPDPWETRA